MALANGTAFNFKTAQAQGSRVVSVRNSEAGQGRIVVLDGLRGLMTVFVVVSHFFGEVPNGVRALSVGWIAVLMFFVLSGFLVGRLILEKKDHANFFTVFYIRRICRTLPVYLFCVVLVFALMRLVGPTPYMEITREFPLWSYLTFTQNIFMSETNAFGPYWLAPTWTLSVEEQFYLIAPALMIFLPARWLMPVLSAGAVLSVAFRAAIFWGGAMPPLAGLVYLPGCMDALFCGLMAAVVYKTKDVTRYAMILRLAPLAMLASVFVMRLADGTDGHLFEVFSRLIASLGCAAYILSVVTGAPEGERLRSPVLGFFGETSYAVYLIHLMVLGLMHGLILGTAPDLASPAQWAVTLAALPVTVFFGWLITKTIEQPISAYGRRFAWSKERRDEAANDYGGAISLGAAS